MPFFCLKQVFFIDKLSLFFLAVIALVSLPSAIFSIGYLKGELSKIKSILSTALLAIFILSMCLLVTTGNLFLFLIFWELMSLSSYFLVISDYTHEKSVRAGTIYLVMAHIGTASLMAAFCILYAYAGSFDFEAQITAAPLMPQALRNIVFLLLLFGFSAKAGVAPLHIWLPYAHPQAPAYISSIMSGVMIKTAIYGMIRFFVTILGQGPGWWGVLILGLGIVSCLVGVIYALMEHDLKKLLAYHSVENIGIILLGLGLAMFFSSQGSAAVAVLGMCAGLYHLVNHALFKGLLFLCSGSVARGTQGLRDIEKMGGLIKPMPYTAAFFLIGAMGICALPPLNGFVSEWLTFQAFFLGILESAGWVKIFMALSAAGLAVTGGLACACFAKAFGIAFLAVPRSRKAQEAKEAPVSMKSGMALLAALVVLFGVGSRGIAPLILDVAQGALNIGKPDIPLYLVSDLTLVITVLLFISAGAVFLWFKFGLGANVSRYNTWDCGYYALDSRNEYTATAFSKPFRIAFSFFLLPYRKSQKIRDSSYHVRKFSYETHTVPVFKRYIYEPLLRLLYFAAFKMRKLQPGSINLYILYIFVTLIVLVVLSLH